MTWTRGNVSRRIHFKDGESASDRISAAIFHPDGNWAITTNRRDRHIIHAGTGLSMPYEIQGYWRSKPFNLRYMKAYLSAVLVEFPDLNTEDVPDLEEGFEDKVFEFSQSYHQKKFEEEAA